RGVREGGPDEAAYPVDDAARATPAHGGRTRLDRDRDDVAHVPGFLAEPVVYVLQLLQARVGGRRAGWGDGRPATDPQLRVAEHHEVVPGARHRIRGQQVLRVLVAPVLRHDVQARYELRRLPGRYRRPEVDPAVPYRHRHTGPVGELG